MLMGIDTGVGESVTAVIVMENGRIIASGRWTPEVADILARAHDAPDRINAEIVDVLRRQKTQILDVDKAQLCALGALPRKKGSDEG